MIWIWVYVGLGLLDSDIAPEPTLPVDIPGEVIPKSDRF
jgi:hypothetical protein